MSVQNPVPSADTIQRLDLLSKVINAGGVPLMLVFIVAAHTGWIRSPLSDRVIANQVALERLEALVVKQQAFAADSVADLTAEVKQFTQVQTRLLELTKIINCGAIPDPPLRERCLRQ